MHAKADPSEFQRQASATPGRSVDRSRTTSHERVAPRASRDPLGPEPGHAQTALFEVSTEVCHQVGGIYQVIRSKAPTMLERWGDRYTVVGRWDERSAAVEFEPIEPAGWYARLISRLAGEGLVAHHGRWLITGHPRAILLETNNTHDNLAELKYLLWKHHSIESPVSDWHIDQAVLFGDAVFRLLRAAADLAGDGHDAPKRVVAHFHEWLAGLALPELRRHNVPISTVFTTHATLLGRYMASNDELDYDNLQSIDPDAQAARYNVTTEYRIEKSCAHAAHVFTTLSPLTGEECKYILGRSPDATLPNGLNIERFDVGPDFHTMHTKFKEDIHRFVMGHFFPSYSFDLTRTLYFFTSGRFEPANKGFDIALEAMARLNAQLKAFDMDITVVFFILSDRPTHSITPDALEKRGILNELREVCDQMLENAGDKLFPRAAAGSGIAGELGGIWSDLLDDYWRLRYRRTQQAFKRSQLPSVITHALVDDANDPVLNHLRKLQLFNREEDRVKIVYHPEFIKPESPLWGIEYEQFVRGCHLGVFPSAYEPWGYTPLECLAMGVPAITSDLAGFGAYIDERFPDHDKWGINVLRRRGRSFHDSAADLARWLLAYCRLERRGRIDLRSGVERRAWNFSWSRLGLAYHKAHDLALTRTIPQAKPAPRSDVHDD